MELTKSNFEQTISNSDKPVLIDFWAPWCGPCRLQGPVVDELEKELQGKAIIAKVNVDENQEIAVKYGVMSIPTLMVFKNGKLAAKTIGFTSKEKLLSMI